MVFLTHLLTHSFPKTPIALTHSLIYALTHTHTHLTDIPHQYVWDGHQNHASRPHHRESVSVLDPGLKATKLPLFPVGGGEGGTVVMVVV